MEPDPSPDSSINTQITNKDIDSLLGVEKKGKKKNLLYLFSKRVILAVATVTTLLFSVYYLGLV